MDAGHARACVMLLVGMLVAQQFDPISSEAFFTEELDRMWQDTNPVPREHCLTFIVKAWPDKVYRGRTSPHDCLAHAIESYRAGDHEEAFGWIQASVCPDRELQQHMVRHAPAVLEYLLARYGSRVP